MALAFLKKKGFRILEINKRIERWEVDLIAQDGKERVFVEVKTRYNEAYGSPEEAVTQKKQRFLIQAANLYALQQDYEGPIRFDVVSVHLTRGESPRIEHIEDAFY